MDTRSTNARNQVLVIPLEFDGKSMFISMVLKL